MNIVASSANTLALILLCRRFDSFLLFFPQVTLGVTELLIPEPAENPQPTLGRTKGKFTLAHLGMVEFSLARLP